MPVMPAKNTKDQQMTRIDDETVEFPNVAKAMEQMPGATEAATRSLCQSGAEAAQLLSRRTRAWLELPSALSACRTIPEVARVQAQFMQAFWSDWLDTGQRVTAVWTDTLRQQPGPAQEAATSERRTSPPVTEDADPMAVWEWWRTDMKGIVPRRAEGAGSNGSNTH